jgi:Cu(I)/Ag(I) efflux system membrane fusion protein
MKTQTGFFLGAALAALLVVVPGCRAKGDSEAAGPDGAAAPAPAAAAPASLTLTAEAIATANIKTAPAQVRALARLIKAPSELELNARRVVHLTARTPGRLERVLVVRGDRVREGQALAEIYSPAFLTVQAEYLQAAARARRLAGDPAEDGQARKILAGARERVRVLGISPAEFDALDASGVPLPLLTVRAPMAGTVLESAVVAGDSVELGTSLFRLADLSTLWARMHIQERDLSTIQAGAEVVLRTQAYPEEEFRGRLILVGDVLDAGTRTVEGRVEVANIKGRLKPGMFAEATVGAAGERRVLVGPAAALQDDEGRAIVFVRTGERTFVRREVQAGERVDGHLEILTGLAEGEEVVISGGFLLKSEMRKGSLEDEHGHD